jgi:hypothetical protein
VTTVSCVFKATPLRSHASIRTEYAGAVRRWSVGLAKRRSGAYDASSQSAPIEQLRRYTMNSLPETHIPQPGLEVHPLVRLLAAQFGVVLVVLLAWAVLLVVR